MNADVWTYLNGHGHILFGLYLIMGRICEDKNLFKIINFYIQSNYFELIL
jgi:hypothetical protein